MRSRRCPRAGQKALDSEPYLLLGPGYSGSGRLRLKAGITQIMGGEAAELTQMGDKFLFRTSFGQQSSMPKVATYINDELNAKSVAIVWVNKGQAGPQSLLQRISVGMHHQSLLSKSCEHRCRSIMHVARSTALVLLPHKGLGSRHAPIHRVKMRGETRCNG